MSIEVRFYTGYSKKQNSTKQPANTDTFTKFDCTLKEGCNILNPEIEIYLSSGDPSGFNYAHIPSFRRYYFVSDWTYFHGTWTASLSVDVLASFRDEIKSTNFYCLRTSSLCDPSITDSYYPPTGFPMTRVATGLSPFVNYSATTGSFILGIQSAPAGTVNANSYGAVTYYYATRSNMVQFIRYLMSDTFVNTYMIGTDVTDAIAKNFADPLQYISSCMYFPFDARSSALLPAVKPKLGWWDLSNDSNVPNFVRIDSLNKELCDNTYKITVPKNFYATSNTQYMNKAPYCEYTFTLEPFGTIPLSADVVGNITDLYYNVYVDYVSGMGRLILGNGYDSYNLGEFNAMVGVPVELAQITQDILGSGSSLFSGVASTTASLLTGNIAGAIGSAIAGISSSIGAMTPQGQSTGENGSLLAYIGTGRGPYLINRCRPSFVHNDADWGMPYCNFLTPQTQSTPIYLVVDPEPVSYPCLREEKEMIRNYLSGGFFYE